MDRYVKTLNIDIDRKLYEPIILKQKDTIRCLNIFLLSKGVAYDLTGLTVRLFVRKQDGNVVYKQANITNATAGQCRIDITTQMLTVPGTVDTEIGIFDIAEDGSVENVLSTIPFTMKVIESVRDDKAIVSTNDYSDILDNIITAFLNDKISGGVITGLGLTDGDITENLIAANAIGEEKIKDNAVTADKTDFLNLVDLFNSTDIEEGYALNSMGHTTINASGTTSGFIEVKANGTYLIPGSISSICTYDNSKQLIERLTDKSDYSYTPTADGYIRFTWDNTSVIEHHVYVKGDYEFSGEIHNIPAKSIVGELSENNIPKTVTDKLLKSDSVDTSNLKNNSVTTEKVNFLKTPDLFNKDDVEIGRALNTLGKTIPNSLGNTSGYMFIRKGETYTIPGLSTAISFFDSNKTFIERITKQRDYTATASADGYVRFTFTADTTSDDYISLEDAHLYIKDSIEFICKLKNIDASGITGKLSSENLPSEVTEMKDNIVDNTIYLKWDATYNNLYIYMKATEGWLRYIFKHQTRDSATKVTAIEKGDSLASCYDVWRERGVYLATKNQDNTFNDPYPNDPLIHSAAEWETAIKTWDNTNNKYHDDFIGGSVHGDEITEHVVFVVDGVFYTDVTKLDGLTCKELRIFRSGSMYECGTLELDNNLAVTSGNKLANHTVDYLYKDSGLVINQNVTWVQATKCDYSLLTMLGVRRITESSGIQVSNKGIRENEAIISDCSVPNFTDPIATSIGNCNKAFLWNDGTVENNAGWNCTFTTEVLEQTDMPGKNFKVSNHDSYNKMYFGYCGLDQVVNVGDVWHNKAKYKIDFKGAY